MPNFMNDDLSLFYIEKGSGRLLLILPGNTASSACHVDELDYFGQGFHAVSFDFRGTGKSQRLSSRSKGWWEECADDAAALISHLGEKSGIVMGTSGGAIVALLLALKYPEYVSGIVADSCAEFYSPENLRREVTGRSRRTKEMVEFWKYANGEDWEAVVDADSRLLLDFADQGGNLFNRRLNRIRCPVLLTGSLKDSSIPDIGEQNLGMAGQIPHSTVFLHNGGDHPFMWTRPELFRSMSSEFLRRWEAKENMR